MTNFINKINSIMFYIFIIYMMTMTGLYFHMDSRINALQVIQTNSLDLFKKYSEKDLKQQGDIDAVNAQMSDIKNQIHALDTNMERKLSNLTELLIKSMGKKN